MHLDTANQTKAFQSLFHSQKKKKLAPEGIVNMDLWGICNSRRAWLRKSSGLPFSIRNTKYLFWFFISITKSKKNLPFSNRNLCWVTFCIISLGEALWGFAVCGSRTDPRLDEDPEMQWGLYRAVRSLPEKEACSETGAGRVHSGGWSVCCENQTSIKQIIVINE